MDLAKIVEQLLYAGEGDDLDFKRDQYPFDRATDEQKGELLKDILAFANAWRRTDAYILIGVEEVPGGGRSTVVGTSDHIDDAKLQQFVNSKTQKPLTFSYQTVIIDGKDVDVITIPIQERPFFLKKDYGRLKKELVYVRRGSSTAIASPDEIAEMGKSSYEDYNIPDLKVEFYDIEQMTPIGQSWEKQSIYLNIPLEEEIPSYRAELMPGFEDPTMNKGYFRQAAKYLQTELGCTRLDFVVTNNSSVLANDVRLICDIEDDGSIYFIMGASDRPAKPRKNYDLVTSFTNKHEDDITVQETPTCWKVQVSFGKIQPQGTSSTTSGFYIGCRKTTDLKLQCRLSADNIPSPQEQELTVKIVVEEKEIDVQGLLEL
jgi:hypothetical protein